jgi:hypothetical protein
VLSDLLYVEICWTKPNKIVDLPYLTYTLREVISNINWAIKIFSSVARRCKTKFCCLGPKERFSMAWKWWPDLFQISDIIQHIQILTVEQIWLHFFLQFCTFKRTVYSEFLTNTSSDWENESFVQQISP